MPRVEILMALFDGERFLGQQLESLARQSHRAWSLSIRDDGSRDNGPAIARAFATTMPGRAIQVRTGAHLGAARNFLALIKASDPGADFLAFCDQDDVWHPGKLARAIDSLSALPEGLPALYCGPTIVTDAGLFPIGRSPEFRRPPAFENALVQSIAGGNTMVINRAAADILQIAAGYRGPIPAHDWWTYQVITGVGGVVLRDDHPMVLYRQHGRNLIGSNAGTLARLARLRALARGQLARWSDQNIAALTAISPLLTPRNRALVEEFAALRAQPVRDRLRRLAASGIHRQTRGGQAALLAAAALSRI